MSATDAVKLLKGDEGGTCDWGDCDNAAVALRKKGAWPEWLPVCPYHLPDVFFQPIVIEAWEAGLSRSIESLDLSDEAINLSAVSAALSAHTPGPQTPIPDWEPHELTGLGEGEER